MPSGDGNTVQRKSPGKQEKWRTGVRKGLYQVCTSMQNRWKMENAGMRLRNQSKGKHDAVRVRYEQSICARLESARERERQRRRDPSAHAILKSGGVAQGEGSTKQLAQNELATHHELPLSTRSMVTKTVRLSMA